MGGMAKVTYDNVSTTAMVWWHNLFTFIKNKDYGKQRIAI